MGSTMGSSAEFRAMVDTLHRHGIEVILDVVYNHTAEGNALGPTLSWRGLDHAAWYALDPHGRHLNPSGCGNTFNMGNPHVVQMIMDSLRWWVQAYGVDGFRFDLASTLARQTVTAPAAGLFFERAFYDADELGRFISGPSFAAGWEAGSPAHDVPGSDQILPGETDQDR